MTFDNLILSKSGVKKWFLARNRFRKAGSGIRQKEKKAHESGSLLNLDGNSSTAAPATVIVNATKHT